MKTKKWAGTIGFEGLATGDNRIIEPEALHWATLPMPIRYTPEDVGAHDGAQVVGLIESLERLSLEDANKRLTALGRSPIAIEGADDSLRVIWGAGSFDTEGRIGIEAARHVENLLTTGVSMDLDDVSFEVRTETMAAEPTTEQKPAKEMMVTTKARIRAATIVAIPAFEGARIALATDTPVEEPDAEFSMDLEQILAEIRETDDPDADTAFADMPIPGQAAAPDPAAAPVEPPADPAPVAWQPKEGEEAADLPSDTVNALKSSTGGMFDAQYPVPEQQKVMDAYAKAWSDLDDAVMSTKDPATVAKAASKALDAVIKVVEGAKADTAAFTTAKEALDKAASIKWEQPKPEEPKPEDAQPPASQDGPALQHANMAAGTDTYNWRTQWRNPHNGQWIDMPGVSFLKALDLLQNVGVKPGQDRDERDGFLRTGADHANNSSAALEGGDVGTAQAEAQQAGDALYEAINMSDEGALGDDDHAEVQRTIDALDAVDAIKDFNNDFEQGTDTPEIAVPDLVPIEEPVSPGGGGASPVAGVGSSDPADLSDEDLTAELTGMLEKMSQGPLPLKELKRVGNLRKEVDARGLEQPTVTREPQQVDLDPANLSDEELQAEVESLTQGMEAGTLASPEVERLNGLVAEGQSRGLPGMDVGMGIAGDPPQELLDLEDVTARLTEDPGAPTSAVAELNQMVNDAFTPDYLTDPSIKQKLSQDINGWLNEHGDKISPDDAAELRNFVDQAGAETPNPLGPVDGDGDGKLNEEEALISLSGMGSNPRFNITGADGKPVVYDGRRPPDDAKGSVVLGKDLALRVQRGALADVPYDHIVMAAPNDQIREKLLESFETLFGNGTKAKKKEAAQYIADRSISIPLYSAVRKQIDQVMGVIQSMGVRRPGGMAGETDMYALESTTDTFNWVEDVGGLPKYIKRIEKHLRAKGMTESHAIATAVNVVKKACATGDLNFPGKQNENAKSRAEACAAVAEWEAKKARARATAAIGVKPYSRVLVASGAAATALAAPIKPPEAWFTAPKFDGPTSLTVTPEGRVYGHLATWDVCHLAMPNGINECVAAPMSKSGYSLFHLGVVETAEGTEVPTGRITMSTGHADDHFSSRKAVAHYENTGNAIADVRAYEDEYGIVLAGALRPDATPAQVRALKASPLSGDWRHSQFTNSLELVMALAVNMPGFPVPRPKGLVASGALQTLVAAGMVAPKKVRAPGRPGALSADDIRYLKQLAAKERDAQNAVKLAAELAERVAQAEQRRMVAAFARKRAREGKI